MHRIHLLFVVVLLSSCASAKNAVPGGVDSHIAGLNEAISMHARLVRVTDRMKEVSCSRAVALELSPVLMGHKDLDMLAYSAKTRLSQSEIVVLTDMMNSVNGKIVDILEAVVERCESSLRKNTGPTDKSVGLSLC